MTLLENFTATAENIAQFYKKGRIARFLLSLMYHYKRLRNDPFPFLPVGAEGKRVGGRIEVIHMTLHDMMEHQACGILTEKLLREGLRANAYQVVGFAHLDKWHGVTNIQPRWVNPKLLEKTAA